MLKTLIDKYRDKKSSIKRRLKDFKKVWDRSDERIFSELCFCICTPQSKAVCCGRAISELERSGVLYNGSVEDIRSGLKAVRFPNNKAEYIFEARNMLSENGRINIKNRIEKSNIQSTREWVVDNVKGIGYKEASHFLRNIGFGEDLAILDVHILRNMLRFRVIREMPKTVTRRIYYDIEGRIRGFSKKINIPMDELDLLLWSNETGEIFK